MALQWLTGTHKSRKVPPGQRTRVKQSARAVSHKEQLHVPTVCTLELSLASHLPHRQGYRARSALCIRKTCKTHVL